MLKFKDLTFDEKNYWGLIYLAKCVDFCSDLTENEFIIKCYNDYQFKELLGCSFLLVTSFHQNIYSVLTDLSIRFGFKLDMSQLDKNKKEEIKIETFKKYENIFINKNNLLNEFCEAYNLK